MCCIDLCIVVYSILMLKKSLVGLVGYRRLGAAMVHSGYKIE